MVSPSQIFIATRKSCDQLIRAELEEGGYEQRAEVLKEAYKWVGDPDAQTPGTLNAEPWNVPIGAP